MLKARFAFSCFAICLVIAGCGSEESSTDSASMMPESGVDNTQPSTAPGASPTVPAANGTDTPAPVEPGAANPTDTSSEPTRPPMPVEQPCPEGQNRMGGACVPESASSDGIDPELIQKFVGVYAVQMRIVMLQNVPLLGELENVSKAFAFVEGEDGNGGPEIVETGCGNIRVWGRHTGCDSRSHSPVGRRASPLTVWEENGTLKWSRPQITVPIGVRLDDPTTDALPTDANDQESGIRMVMVIQGSPSTCRFCQWRHLRDSKTNQ